MSKKIVWGIIGLGHIAHKFAHDLSLCSNSILGGVASRSLQKAKEFSIKYAAQKYYVSYAELVEDSNISVVYIATPHAFHYEHSLLALKAGKSVLCEKPMGLNSFEVNSMISEARKRKLFLMEGIWTRFIPMTQTVIDLIRDDCIGKIKSINADFGFVANTDPKGRMYNKKLGGGSLLDIGIYPVYLSLLLLGLPKRSEIEFKMTETGVDSVCAIELSYENGEKAFLESNILKETPTEALIVGEKGSIKIHKRFHHAEKITLNTGNKTEIIEIKYKGNGYCHEIEEVEKCLINGQVESTLLPHNISISLMSIIDELKLKMGLSY